MYTIATSILPIISSKLLIANFMYCLKTI